MNILVSSEARAFLPHRAGMAASVATTDEIPETSKEEKESPPQIDLVSKFNETVSANEATFVVFYRGLW